MASIVITGVRRTDYAASAEVETSGGWVKWRLLPPKVQVQVLANPEFATYSRSYTTDSWQDAPFVVSAQNKYDNLGGGGGTDGGDNDDDTDGDTDEVAPDDAAEEYSDGASESDTETESESESDGGGDGDDPIEAYVLAPKTDDPERGEIPLGEAVAPIVTDAVSKLAEKFANVIGEVRSELMLEIAQAVMAEATDRADADIVLDAKTVAMIESLERKFERKIKAARGESGIFKIEVTVGNKVEIKEGLYHSAFPTLLRMIGAGMHVYLPGPPGTGKSHMAEQVADTLGWKFGAISLGPTTPESRLWGGMDAHGHFHEPLLIQCLRYAQDNPEHGAIFCLDEMDNGHSGIIATLNSLMANGWVTAPNGDIIRVGANFSFIACANTYGTGPTAEFSGRNKLDAATLDRFQYVPVPTDLNVESTMVNAWLEPLDDGARIAEDWLAAWRTARKNAADNGLKVFVTMRGAINGARLLRAGFDIEETFAVVLGNKLPADQLTKISPF